MRWLSGPRLGVVALSNVTYAPMTPLVAEMLVEVERQLGPDDVAADVRHDRVERAGRRLAALLAQWDDDEAAALFADNVELDDAWHRRRRASEPVAGLGDVVVEAVNDGRGRLTGSSATGATVKVSFALAPDDVTRIQTYEITSPG